MNNVLSMLEIDVMQFTELFEASELCVKNGMPAMVVHPGLAADALLHRLRVRGQYKIIIPIDWPKGDMAGISKFRGVSKEALEADGFEIALNLSKTMSELRQEADLTTEFIRRHLGEFVEVRFVFSAFSNTEEEILKAAEAMSVIRMPAFIRNDTTLKIQHSKANPETHSSFQNTVKTHTACPIKICGNIGSLKSTAACSNVSRFGVSLQQAKTIIKEFTHQPSELMDILADT